MIVKEKFMGRRNFNFQTTKSAESSRLPYKRGGVYSKVMLFVCYLSYNYGCL